MRLDTEFIQLPLSFDAERLRLEIDQFDEQDWRPHPQGFPGNSALLLVAKDGDPTNDDLVGEMLSTPLLDQCPYLKQVLSSFESVIGRTRLMRLAPHAEATPHVDLSYYWHTHTRVHVPIVTHPDIRFICGDRETHMAAGECWLFDTWRTHNVINDTETTRVHLVCDIVGSPAFWSLSARGRRPFKAGQSEGDFEPRDLGFAPEAASTLQTEVRSFPLVMPAEQLAQLIDGVEADLEGLSGEPDGADLLGRLRRFQSNWSKLWTAHGDQPSGWDAFQALKRRFGQIADSIPQDMAIERNGSRVSEYLRQAIHAGLLSLPSEQSETPAGQPAPGGSRRPGNMQSGRLVQNPVFIVAAPRSGSTFLFETLARSPDFWTIGGESHGVFESMKKLRPENRDFHSNRLLAVDADIRAIKHIRQSFLKQLQNHQGQLLSQFKQPEAPVRMLEKTPKNALRIPFIREVYPDARFIYLYRDPAENIGSIIDAWDSGKFVTYPTLPNWEGPPWSLLLTPDWQDLAGCDVAEIAAQQWRVSNQTIMEQLHKMSPEDWTVVRYADLIDGEARDGEFERLAQFCGVPWSIELAEALPLSKHTLTAPKKDKWRRHEDRILPLLGELETVADQSREMLETARANPVNHRSAPARKKRGSKREEALRSVHTESFHELLQKARASLVISTYQAGKLVIARPDHAAINTHFINFAKPMGVAVEPFRMAVGGAVEVVFFQNVPGATRQLQPEGRHDACYLPRGSHITGNIDIHEMTFVDGELWAVNTKFSCLCRFDELNSFVPTWRPPFVSAYAAEDRCHLNGLCARDGRVRYVSALGQTDSKGGWRESKADGGIIMDIASNEMVCEGLSMPHSPRWYDNQLWVLESGKGSLARVDIESGAVETVCTLPGFTRGLDFIGPYALVGLSQVRESIVFSGLPITERREERNCGVWVVDTRSGEISGLLKFENRVQEIFAVQVLRGQVFPEIVDVGHALIANSFVIPDEAMAEVAHPQSKAQAAETRGNTA